MSRLLPIVLALCALILSSRDAWSAPRARHVFIVSFDGGKPEVMLRSRMPTLFGMARRGASTARARTVFPSTTLVSHTSMLTGVGPAKHGILWNDWKPERGMVTVPTIFGLAKAQKLKTAMFVGKAKFLHLFLPDALSEFSLPSYSAKTITDIAARYIAAEKPNLCFIHFADSDGAGHKYGWGSPEQIRTFGELDRALATIQRAIVKAGIVKESVVLLTADHGGHAKTHGTASPDDMIIPWVAWGAGVKPRYVITAPITTYDTAATALWLLDVPIPAGWDGVPVRSAFIDP